MMMRRNKRIQSKQMKKISLYTWCWSSQTELKIFFQIKKIWNHEKKQETEKRKNLWSEKSEKRNHTEWMTCCKTYSSSDSRQDKVKMMMNREDDKNKSNNNADNNSSSSNSSDKLNWEIFMFKQNQQRNQNQNWN